VEADGLERIYGLPQDIASALARRAAECGVQASVAIAANPDAAVHAARGFAGVNVIPYGDEAKFWEPALALLDSIARDAGDPGTLGIWRFHDLAALPELGIAERLDRKGCVCTSWRAARASAAGSGGGAAGIL